MKKTSTLILLVLFVFGQTVWAQFSGGTGTLQMIDVMGRVVVCTDVARNVSTSGMTAGVYVLRLVGEPVGKPTWQKQVLKVL